MPAVAVLRRPALALFLLAAAAIPARAEDYQIKLARTAKVGEHYAMVSKGNSEQHVTVTVGGAATPPRDQVIAVEVSAKAEVLAVSAEGCEITTAFTVTKSSVTSAGAPGELVPAGTVIKADSSGGKSVFTINGAPAAPEVAQALEVVIHLNSPKTTTDDDIFGSAKRHAVGDSWPVNSAAAAADLAKDGTLQFDPTNLTGKTTLVEVASKTSVPALHITAVMEIGKVAVPLPPGMSITKGHVTGHFSGIFPVDVSKRCLNQGTSIESHFDCGGQAQGKDMTMTMVMKQSYDATFTY